MPIRYDGNRSSDLLRPEVVDAVLTGVLDAMRPKEKDDHGAALSTELATLDREIERLTEAIATGGEMLTLLSALRQRQVRRDELQASRARLAQPRSFDRGAIERRVRESLADWRALLTRNTQDGRAATRRADLPPFVASPTGTADRWRLKVVGFSDLAA